jgi:hypothetical protein
VPDVIDPVPPAPGRGETVLIHGNAGPALALWAAGLARQADPGFAWADLASVPPGTDKVVRLLMARSSDGAWVNGVTPHDMLPPSVPASAVTYLLGAGGADGALPARLETYLELPSLLQLLASHSTRSDGRSTIVLLGIDSLPRGQLDLTFAAPTVHGILRREGIQCLVTYDGEPPGVLSEQFDRVFEIERSEPRQGARTTVRSTRGVLLEELRAPRSMAEQWTALGLPQVLLSLWSIPGVLPVRPR